MLLLLSFLVNEKARHRKADGLESSRVGWAAHHSLSLLVDTL
jgi:hypothetical protein